MKKLGGYFIAIGVIVFGVAAVMRRVLTPDDIANIGLGRALYLVPMGLGLAIFVIGIIVQRRAKQE